MRKVLPVAFVLTTAFALSFSSSATPPVSASPDEMAWQVFVTMTADTIVGSAKVQLTGVRVVRG